MPVLADLLDDWAGRAAVLELFGVAAAILGVVIVRTCVPLATKTRLFLAALRFVIVQHELGIVPLVLRVGRQALHDLTFAMVSARRQAGVEDWRAQVIMAVAKGAMRAVLLAVAIVVRLVNACRRLTRPCLNLVRIKSIAPYSSASDSDVQCRR